MIINTVVITYFIVKLSFISALLYTLFRTKFGRYIKSFLLKPFNWINSKVYKYILMTLSAIILTWFTITWMITFSYVTQVTDKQTTYSKTIKDSNFLVFTDATTFTVDDTLLFLRLDSSDFFGEIKKDNCYKLTSYGLRIGFLSMYPNIVGFKKVKCEE